MPTGYTSALYDGANQELNDFIKHCSTAFLFHQKECGATYPIYRQVKTYEIESLNDLIRKLNKLTSLDWKDVVNEYDKEFDAADKFNDEYDAQKENIRKNYESMLEEVEKWTPPTEKHISLKKFMIDQLKDSIKFDCWETDDDSIDTNRPTVEEWYHNEIKSLKRRIYRKYKEIQSHIKSVIETNEWIDDLLESLDA